MALKFFDELNPCAKNKRLTNLLSFPSIKNSTGERY